MCLIKCLEPMRWCRRHFRALLNQVVTCFCAGQTEGLAPPSEKWSGCQARAYIRDYENIAVGGVATSSYTLQLAGTHALATAGVAHITVVRSVTSASISFSSLDGYG